jgi:nucleotide-binding universal stress UspA family protein
MTAARPLVSGKERTMLPVKTILHPTDFSPQAAHALEVACSLARDCGARLVLLHIQPPEVIYGDGFVLPPEPGLVRKGLEERLRGVEIPDPTIRVERVVEEGDPAAKILHVAGAAGADLIVMGTHGRTGGGRLLTGSVAEEVLRRAGCPVLTVKAPAPAAPPRAGVATPEAVKSCGQPPSGRPPP